LFRYAGFQNIHGMNAGWDLEFLNPIRVGEEIRTETWLENLVEHKGRYSGRAVEEKHAIEYRSPDGRIFAKGGAATMRIDRQAGGKSNRYAGYQRGRYTSEDMTSIDKQYAGETRRGAEPRYWEDVSINDAVQPRIKGPLLITDIIAFMMGGFTAFIRGSSRVQYLDRQRKPHVYVTDSHGVPDIPERVHWENGLSTDLGLVAGYDYGPQRTGWLGHMLTDYAGDAGWLRRLQVKFIRHNFIYDTSWCHGVVTAKREGPEIGTVDLDVWIQDQRGERTAEGTATLELPLRARTGAR